MGWAQEGPRNMDSVNIKKAKNGYIVSAWDERTQHEVSTVHKTMKDAAKAVGSMMGGMGKMEKKLSREMKKVKEKMAKPMY